MAMFHLLKIRTNIDNSKMKSVKLLLALSIYVNHLNTIPCQHAEITLVFVPTSIFTFSYTTDIK